MCHVPCAMCHGPWTMLMMSKIDIAAIEVS